MAKPFPEVFPDLHMEENLQELLGLVEVERVASNRDRSSVRIYIKSPRLIQKKDIYSLEKAIRDQLFPGRKLAVKIVERYRLSSQYTPEKLLDVYRDSVLLELKNYSIIEYSMFRRAECAFPEPDLLHLTVEDTMVNREKAPELKRVLEKIFHERCGLPAEVQFSYVKPEASRVRRQKQLQLTREVEEITMRSAVGSRQMAAGQAAEGDEEFWSRAMAMAQDGNVLPEGENPPELSLPPWEEGAVSPAASGAGADRSLPRGAAPEKSPSPGAPSRAGAGRSLAGGSKKGSFKKGGFKKGEYAKGENRRAYHRSDNPDVLYGRDFEGDFTEIDKIDGVIGETILRGKIIHRDSRELRSGKTMFMFDVTDFTDTMTVKIFAEGEALEDLKTATKEGTFVRVKGVISVDKFDGELTLSSVVGIKKGEDFTGKRMDNSLEKRVELHCHTKMSDMDGVSEVKDIIKRAKKWGMDAIAVTDHGCVQGFPDANHALEKGDEFKVIYGVEGYLVDDLKLLVENPRGQSLQGNFVVFDLETTGLSPEKNRIIEIGAVRVERGEIVDRFSAFVNPEVPIPFEIEKLTGINDAMVIDAPKIEEILPKFLDFCGEAALVGHNAAFDVSFVAHNAARLGIPFSPTVLDTVTLAQHLLPNLNRYKLDTVAKALNVSLENHHRAVDDAGATAEIFAAFVKMLADRGVEDVDQLNAMSQMSADMIKKMPTYHVILLADSDEGRVNLYRLVSFSHLDYFARRPRIPKSVLQKYRKGLIIGSACEAGELYQALLRGASDEAIARLVDFYDYLEIQPLGNNAFMLKDEKSTVKTLDDLIAINKKIVDLGDKFGKPVCATCDVHFLDPEDEIYRRIIMAGQGFKDSDEQAPLYLRTTEEMLKEFEYLGPNKAYEVVVTNTRKIAARCQKISPVRPDKCPPVIPDSDKTLRKICYDRAHEIYGEELPEIVVARLERELNSIISNGFAVMYIIAQKLVWKSNEDGYLVGSRGSVGSSFVATMAGITEVNPLSPHYICPNCHYYDFDSEEVKKFGGMAGCDMPDKLCPVCGTPLKKEGFDIPFLLCGYICHS